MPKPVIHGRDHAPGGADPIPGLGESGGGIQFETYPQEGGWLYVETNDMEMTGGEPSDTAFTSMRLHNTGGAGMLLTDVGGGGIMLRVGSGLSGSPGGGGIQIVADSGGISLVTYSGGEVYVDATAIYLTAPDVRLPSIPTTDPGDSGALWNSGGTLMIS